MAVRKFATSNSTTAGTHVLLPALSGTSYNIVRVGMCVANTAGTGCQAIFVQCTVPDASAPVPSTIAQLDIVPSVANVQNMSPSDVNIVTKSNTAVNFGVFGGDSALSVAWIEYYEINGVTQYPDEYILPGR